MNHTKLYSLFLASVLVFTAAPTIALAAESEMSAAKAEKMDDDECIRRDQGLIRERAEYRARKLDEKHAEEEAKKELRKGAGLDRDRADERARKLEERRKD